MKVKSNILKHPHFDYWFYGSLAYLAYFLFATYREFSYYAELKTPLIYAVTVHQYFGAWTTYILPLFSVAMVLPFVHLRKMKSEDGPSNKVFRLFVFWVIASCPYLISLACLFIGPFKREEIQSVDNRNLGLRVSYVRTERFSWLLEDRIDIYLMKLGNPWNHVSLYSGIDPDIYQNEYTVKYRYNQLNISDPLCSEVHSKLNSVQFNGTEFKLKYFTNVPPTAAD